MRTPSIDTSVGAADNGRAGSAERIAKRVPSRVQTAPWSRACTGETLCTLDDARFQQKPLLFDIS